LYFVRPQFRYRGVDTNLEAQWELSHTFTVVGGGGLIADREELPSNSYIQKARIGDQPAAPSSLRFRRPAAPRPFSTPAPTRKRSGT